MPSNNENPLVPNEDSPNISGGLLGDILSSADTSSDSQVDLLSESFIEEPDSFPEVPLPIENMQPPATPTPPPKLPKKSINTGTFLRIV